jgi:hypothetical protein
VSFRAFYGCEINHFVIDFYTQIKKAFAHGDNIELAIYGPRAIYPFLECVFTEIVCDACHSGVLVIAIPFVEYAERLPVSVILAEQGKTIAYVLNAPTGQVVRERGCEIIKLHMPVLFKQLGGVSVVRNQEVLCIAHNENVKDCRKLSRIKCHV